MVPRGSLASIIWTAAALSACGGSDLLLPGDGGPGNLVMVSGDDQQGRTGKPLAKPLIVQVNDGQGRPAAGAPVAFVGSSGNPAVDPVNATTDDKGQASTRVTLGDVEGTQTIEAQLAGASTKVSVVFHATATAPPNDNGNGGGGNGGGGGGGGGEGD